MRYHTICSNIKPSCYFHPRHKLIIKRRIAIQFYIHVSTYELRWAWVWQFCFAYTWRHRSPMLVPAAKAQFRTEFDFLPMASQARVLPGSLVVPKLILILFLGSSVSDHVTTANIFAVAPWFRWIRKRIKAILWWPRHTAWMGKTDMTGLERARCICFS